jgi:hypothetical protein
LIIRRAQLRPFEEAASPEFETVMVSHLATFSPLHSASLGDSGIRMLIRAGIEHAAKHGFNVRWTVNFYIECMILLGAEFDTDPQYPRAGSILRDRTVPDQTERADLLHAWLMHMLERAAGPNRDYAKQALVRARRIPFQAIPVSADDFADESIRRMRENHPEKVACLGERVLRDLIPRAMAEAETYSIGTDLGVCLLLGLMFAVGHGVTRDPKYPWVAATLTNPAITDREKRVERLYSKTMTYLDHVLQHIGPVQ